MSCGAAPYRSSQSELGDERRATKVEGSGGNLASRSPRRGVLMSRGRDKGRNNGVFSKRRARQNNR